MATKNKIRYELEVEGAKAYLAPLTFQIAEAALGFMFKQFPKKITAGEILLNSLILDAGGDGNKLKSDKKFKTADKNGNFWVRACMEASKILDGIEYEKRGDSIVVKLENREYSATLKQNISREVLEDAIGLINPNVGNPLPLSAGKKILFDCWIDGDEEIKKNDELLISFCLAAYYRIDGAEASLKKL